MAERRRRVHDSPRLRRPRIQAIAAAVRAGDQAKVNALVLDSIAEHMARYVAERMIAQTSSAEITSGE